MRCPKCQARDEKGVRRRAIKDETVIRRRRECLACEHRFTSYEEIERDDLRVLKRDGRYEVFDRKKMVAGIDKACEKRPVSREAIEKTVNEMIDELIKNMGEEI